MSIAGVRPERGLRVALELQEVAAIARYRGFAHFPDHDLAVALEIDAASGATRIVVNKANEDNKVNEPLGRAEQSFLEQLGKQAFRLATQTPADEGGGRWPRRIQRWRGPK